MRRKWKYIIIAVFFILVLFLLASLKTGNGTRTGGFNFIQNDEHGVEFIYTPPEN